MELDSIIKLINNDQGLSAAQKQELTQEEGKKNLEKLLSGAGGAAIGLAIAKFTKLSKIAQILLSAAGFGVGVLVYNYVHRQRFSTYNPQNKMYEIDTDKF